MTRIRGERELERALQALQDVVRSDVLERSLTAAAQPIQSAARQNAPVLTGTLRRSIHTETTEKSAQRVWVQVGTDLEYAAIHEFGGEIRPRRARALVFEINGEVVVTQLVRIPARPYLRPAFDQHRDEAVQTFRRSVADQIRAVVG